MKRNKILFDKAQSLLPVVFLLIYFIYITSTNVPTKTCKYLHLQLLVDFDLLRMCNCACLVSISSSEKSLGVGQHNEKRRQKIDFKVS